MIRVENKKTIKRVADISFRADRMRNLFAVIAVILTTVLFSGLFTIASSLLASMEESTMRQVGTSAHGGFKYLTKEQYDIISQHPSIQEISYSVILGVVENEELQKRQTEIRYAKDALEAEMSFSLPTTGRMPESADELATDTLVLQALGISARLGEQVTLTYSVCGQKYTHSFTLVGFWEGDIIMSASQVWLDRGYVEDILGRHDLSQTHGIIGSMNADVNFSNSWNIEKKVQRVITESGYSLDEVAYGVNWAYMGGSNIVNPELVLGVALVIFMIIFCGYLMISNVFLISVAKDVHFYGLLKTIGTTGTQIKVLIRRQAIRIGVIGIPIGLALGCVIGAWIAPILLRILNTNVTTVSIKWWIFVFASVFAMVTVLLSIQKAMKLAAKVSPIEALRTTDVTTGRKKQTKMGQKISLWKMAMGNIDRNRKKAIFVTISLSLSLIILNSAYTMANSFDMERYLSNMIGHDFVIGDVSWFNVYAKYTDQDTIHEEFIREIKEHGGIERIERIYFSEEFCELDEHWEDMAERAKTQLGLSGTWLEQMQQEIEQGSAVYHVYGMDDAAWSELTVWHGEIDLEKLYTGDYVVVSPYDSEGRLCAYDIGDTIEVFSTTGKSRSCEVLAIASIPYNMSIQHAHPVDINIFLPSEVFLEHVETKAPMLLALDVEDSHLENMEYFLEEYGSTIDKNMQYASRATYAEEYENTQRTYKIVGTVISVLLALIGIANFANTSITSIMSRKRELAMLESIGMTVKQQRSMLVLEGMIYMALAVGFTWTAGVLLGNIGLQLMLGGSDYFVIHFTIIPSLVCMPILFLHAILIPIGSQRYVNHESVVERLRRE